MLVPKEMKVEHAAGLKGLSDEELEQMLAVLREMVKAGEAAKVIEGEEEVVSLPTPATPTTAGSTPTQGGLLDF